MVRRFALLIAGLVVLPGVASGQQAGDDVAYVTRAELKSELNKISQQIADLGAQPSIPLRWTIA